MSGIEHTSNEPSRFIVEDKFLRHPEEFGFNYDLIMKRREAATPDDPWVRVEVDRIDFGDYAGGVLFRSLGVLKPDTESKYGQSRSGGGAEVSLRTGPLGDEAKLRIAEMVADMTFEVSETQDS